MKTYETVKIERADGIAWVILNRPEKRNAMNPTMNLEMNEVLTELAHDDETRVLVLTGAGDSWCAGVDLREVFRELRHKPAEMDEVNRVSQDWRWYRLSTFPKPTIAMVNGYCFGGAFTQLIACDIAIAADDATFGLSEVNWGGMPSALVSRVLLDALSYRHTMYYVLTGATFNGEQAAAMNLVTRSVPRSRLRDETLALAKDLAGKNPYALRAAKEALKHVRSMDYRQAEDYLLAKAAQMHGRDPDWVQQEGFRQFLDEKTYRPGLGAYNQRD